MKKRTDCQGKGLRCNDFQSHYVSLIISAVFLGRANSKLILCLENMLKNSLTKVRTFKPILNKSCVPP